MSLLRIRFVLLVHVLCASVSFAQFIPSSSAEDRNLTVVRSPANPNITVSYKIPEGACTTAFKTQKQYTGWVNVPSDYPTNLFFWFVEARERTDSLTIWLNGGPGSSSMYGFFTGNGPCEIVENGLNEYDTVAREWGWDRASNMLFIDQPNQVGFSYDTPTNGTIDFVRDNVTQPPIANPGQPQWTIENGTFSSGSRDNTANTTDTAAIAIWHMVQGFLTTFPQYLPTRNSSLGVNLFAESYGGRYGPMFSETFEEQNAKRLSGELPRNTTLEIHLSSLGIINGCVDLGTQTPFYPAFASNNTYGFKALDDVGADFYQRKYASAGGCKDLLSQCGTASVTEDPEGEGDVAGVNDLCGRAVEACFDIQKAYYGAGRSAYDLANPMADPFPPQTFLEFLNQDKVQKAIGTPINFTSVSPAVNSGFADTGDIARDGNIPRLAALLNKGVRIGLIYGDRDYLCNWFGGEAVAQGLAWEASSEYGTRFTTSGYAPVIVNDTYIGGVVRQYGNLSFSRIYQAGHAVPAYQPETAFQVFARIIMGTAISTGEDVDLGVYNSSGSASASHTDDLPAEMEPTCYIRAFRDTCNSDASDLLGDDKGVVMNGVLYSSSQDGPTMTQGPTATPEVDASETFTGVYTATETPDAGEALRAPGMHLPALVAGLFAVNALV